MLPVPCGCVAIWLIYLHLLTIVSNFVVPQREGVADFIVSMYDVNSSDQPQVVRSALTKPSDAKEKAAADSKAFTRPKTVHVAADGSKDSGDTTMPSKVSN